MRWEIAYSSGLLLGIFSGATAFCAPQRHRQAATTTTLNVGGLGWDNENFLEALGGPQGQQEDANEKYYKQSRFGRDVPTGAGVPGQDAPEVPPYDPDTPDTVGGGNTDGLTAEMKAKMQAAHGEESQGGNMFKSLMDRAEQGAVLPREPAAQPPAAPPAQPPAAPPATAATPTMTVEEQAAMYRQLMENPPSAPAAPPDPYEKPPPRAATKAPYGNPTSPDGRRIGRNRDADAIVNTADVYFAQLKRDSLVRNVARYSGNEELANKVFEDPALNDIKLAVNPYVEEMREKERLMIETATEEMIEMGLPTEKRMENAKDFSGVSYKDKLEQMKKKKAGGAAAPPAATPVQAVAQAPAAAPVQQPPVVQAAVVAPPPPPPVVQPDPVVQQAPPAPVAPATQPVAGSDDTMRADARKLMGMLLKHRGGTGFGAGRLKGGDIGTFEQLALDTAVILRDEARNGPGVAEPAFVGQMAAASAPASIGQILTQPVGNDRINSMIACIEGALSMYKNSPPELQEGVLTTLRAALLAAVNTCNDVMGEMPTLPSQPAVAGQPAGDRITSMNAVMEGAIQMYKNSPPELQGAVLVTIRAALLSAVNTCNDVIANNEVANMQAYQAATGTTAAAPPAPVSSKPAKFSDAVQVDAAAPSYSGTDDNSQVLERVYEKLKAASGDGKLGLNKDLSPSDASELADGIAHMRSLLVEELDTGIPDDPSSATKSTSDTGNKYQEMLAKAKAEKEAKKDN